MDLITAKVEAAKASKDGKRIFINVDKDGECTLGKFDPNASTVCYSNGSQVPMPKDEPEEEKVKKEKPVKKVKTETKKKVAQKQRPATVKKEQRIPRGNNMFLTEAEWKKVDAILKKEDKSFSEWSRGLVQAKIK